MYEQTLYVHTHTYMCAPRVYVCPRFAAAEARKSEGAYTSDVVASHIVSRTAESETVEQEGRGPLR